MFTAKELTDDFEYALDNHWGYIWGKAGVLWTDAQQKNLVQYFVNKYGTNWKINSEAKDDSRYRSATLGSKWIGHYVADCSGLFKWAFNKHKVSIAHGSNTIYLSYCSAKGKLSGGRRIDGQTLKIGTAVFVYNSNKDNYKHIGLYVGGSRVIEAQGTDAGVCVSNIAATKWTHWGELKNVNYENVGSDPVQEPAKEDVKPWMPTVRKGSKGDAVVQMQTILYRLGYDLGSYGIDGDYGKKTEAAVKAFQRDHGLAVDGVCGPMTWDALQKAMNQINGLPAEKKYTVCLHGLDKTQAAALKANYPGAIVTEE